MSIMSEFRFFAYTDFEFHTNRSQNLLNLPISPFQPTRRTTTDEISHELNVPYTVFEILVAIFAVIGNLMVIIVFQRDRKLRRRTNYYIVSLAMADFLVGSLGVPFAILASIGMPTNLHACLFTVSLLVVLCTISIFCLVAVSVDRYWAILYPMAYSRNVRTKTAIVIISLCWLAGTVVGFLPLFGWHADVGPNQACLFVEVMDYNYLVFLYFATIITPALLMLAFYAHIYRVIIKQVRQIVTMNPVGDCSRRSSTAQIQLTATGRHGCHGGTMLRVLGAARKRDVKATQNLSIIVLFFMICWIPLYTINCVKAFCPDCYVHPKLTLFCIILSHLNSAVNPVLYAYHLKDFRAALKSLILKIMGVEVEPPNDALHRFSMASQHRLQSMDSSVRNTMQPRIYVDSPIWLRQQQQTLKGSSLVPKCGVVSPCLGNSIGQIHQTVAAVASVPTDIEREMWNIVEAPSGAEMDDVHYEFPSDPDVDRRSSDTPPIPPKRRKSRQQRSSCDYSYSNRNYSTSPDDNGDVDVNDGDDANANANDDDGEGEVEFDEVFLPASQGAAVDAKQLNRSLIACAMREKLRTDDADYQQQLHSSQRALTDSSYSDYDHTPPVDPSRRPSEQVPTTTANLAQPESLSQSSSHSCLANSAVFVIDDSDTNPLSPGHKPKFRKTPSALAKASNGRRPCTSDSSTPTGELTSPHVVRLLGGNNNSSNSSSSHSFCGGGDGSKHNNNSHTTNNLNYYTTIHHPSPAHLQQNHQHQRLHPEKFSPLKAMSNFIFPPIVKHSSLFQLFQPSASGATPVVVAATATAAPKPTRPEPNSSSQTPNATASKEVVDPPPSAPPVVTAAES